MSLLVGFDPATSTGFAIIDDGVVVLSGQCDFPDAMLRVLLALGPRKPDGVGIEYPFIPHRRKGQSAAGHEGRAAAALQTAWKAGVLFGRCVERWPTATMWNPRPSEWRSYIGIKGRDRDVVAENMVAWASATLGVALPKSEHDRAMAVGVASALGDYMKEKAVAATANAILAAQAKRGAA